MSDARRQTDPRSEPVPDRPRSARPRVRTDAGEARGDLLSNVHRLSTLSDFTSDTVLFTSMTDEHPHALAADAFGWIERELGAPIDTVFARLDTWACAGSLGQVHRGLLPDERQVAVKIRYPSVNTVNRDIAAFLRTELDYRFEANALARARSLTRGMEGVLTPTPIGDLTTASLLVMSWVPGEPFTVTRDWPIDARTQTARTLLQFFLRGWLVWGEVYGDPHPGHVRVLRNGKSVSVGFVDFGCLRALSTDARIGLVRLFQARGELDHDSLLEIFGHLGFGPQMLAAAAPTLPETARRLFEPFRRPGTEVLDHWPVFERVTSALGPARGLIAGDPPVGFIPLARSFHGLAHYLRALAAPLDLWQELEDVLRDTSTS
jgi:predicted unusual protein kinase regulating ubiquinone biosynthesis (AarF/ABC1/UbiB family)